MLATISKNSDNCRQMEYGQAIYNQLRRDNIPPVLANLVVAQSKDETDNYTSNVFYSDNNAFGYKWVGQPTATGPGVLSPEGDYYAHYDSLESSAHELALWIYRRQSEGTFPDDLKTITTPMQYATLLKNTGYFGGSLTSYINRITYLLYPYKEAAIASGSVLLIGLFAWLGYKLIKANK